MAEAANSQTPNEAPDLSRCSDHDITDLVSDVPADECSIRSTYVVFADLKLAACLEDLSDAVCPALVSGAEKQASCLPDPDGLVPESVSRERKHLFGRVESMHSVLGSGKLADIILWRNKKMSGGILIGLTIAWFLSEWRSLHGLLLLCHSLILALTVLFAVSNAKYLVERSYLNFPAVVLPEEWFVTVAQEVSYKINKGIAMFCHVGSGKDLKKFLMMISCLWLLSKLGDCLSFMTLLYSILVILGTLPALYERYEDQVEFITEKVAAHFHNYFDKHYLRMKTKVMANIAKFPGLKHH